MTKEKMEKYKQTEKNKTIEDFKRVIANYFSYSSYDLFYSDLINTGIKGTIQNTFADMINLMEKLQKENKELNRKIKVQLETNLRLVDARNGIENEEIRQLNNFIKNDCIPKDKIREKLEKIEKEKIQYYDAGQPLIYMLLKNQLKSLIEEKQ